MCFVIAKKILIIFFQNIFTSKYTLASNTRDGETIFKKVCSNCQIKGGLVITSRSKSLKFSDLEQRGIADINSIEKIANYGIGFMKGYKSKLKGKGDEILAEWIIQKARVGWNK